MDRETRATHKSLPLFQPENAEYNRNDMPRRRRPVRPVRRPSFRPAPESPPEDEAPEDAEPTFADEPAVSVPGYGAGSPVETRPHWNTRVQGRRLEQLRRSSGEARGLARSGGSGTLPTFPMGFIRDEIRQVMITTAVMVVVLVVLTVLLR